MYTLPIEVEKLTELIKNPEPILVDLSNGIAPKKAITYLTNLQFEFTVKADNLDLEYRKQVMTEFIGAKYYTNSPQLFHTFAELMIRNKNPEMKNVMGVFPSLFMESEMDEVLVELAPLLEPYREYFESLPFDMMGFVEEFRPLVENYPKKEDTHIGANALGVVAMADFIEIYNSAAAPKYDTMFNHTSKSGRHVCEVIIARANNSSIGFLDAMAKFEIHQPTPPQT